MITSTDTKLIYDGDGSTTAFPYTFGIIEASNIKVIRIDSDGSEHLLDADYYVDLANGNVNYPGYAPGSAPPVEEQPPVLPVNSKLCIYRSVPQTQGTDLPETYPLSVIEAALDKLTMLLQEIGEITGRSFKLSIGNSAGIDMVLPVEPGKTFKWAADGKSLVLADDPAMVYESAVTLYAAVQAAITATEAARDAAVLARNNANTSAINAANSEDAAEASAIAAAGHEANTLSYKTAAEVAATNAGNSESAIHADAIAAALSESNALSYKNSAQASAGSAATSESNALSYKNSAQASAGNAATSEGNALTYKNAAALSESNALNYKNSAQTSANNAATSKENAGNSATAAHTSELAADASADAAALSESNALSYKGLAQTAAGNAAQSAAEALAYKNQTADLVAAVDMTSYYTKSQVEALIPTTLPASDVSAWAKAGTKPTYNAGEVGASATGHGHVKADISDLPDIPSKTVVPMTLAASSWATSTYTINYANITVNSVITISPASTMTSAQYDAVAGAKIIENSISTGQLVLKALGAVPTINCPVVLIIEG